VPKSPAGNSAGWQQFSPREIEMKLNTYLFFDGNCEAALNFYATALGGKIEMMLRYEGMPDCGDGQMPAGWGDKIGHGRISVGDVLLMGSDAPSGRYKPMQGFSVNIGIDTAEEAERVFHALAEKGTVTMPIAETFWAVRFGMLVDQFGTPWMVNCEKPM
jgi:PhnB protein